MLNYFHIDLFPQQICRKKNVSKSFQLTWQSKVRLRQSFLHKSVAIFKRFKNTAYHVTNVDKITAISSITGKYHNESKYYFFFFCPNMKMKNMFHVLAYK